MYTKERFMYIVSINEFDLFSRNCGLQSKIKFFVDLILVECCKESLASTRNICMLYLQPIKNYTFCWFFFLEKGGGCDTILLAWRTFSSKRKLRGVNGQSYTILISPIKPVLYEDKRKRSNILKSLIIRNVSLQHDSL